jgi:hypothetical protein
MKSIAQQIHSMKRNWPGFAASTVGANHVIWFGELVAIQKPYRIAVEYGLPLNPIDDPMFRRFPVVRVLEPRLRLNYAAAEEAPLPHMYFDIEDLPNSALCLFDPRAGEWSNSDFISLTTIPWISDWLASYESWRATGKWFAGGRHLPSQMESITI